MGRKMWAFSALVASAKLSYRTGQNGSGRWACRTPDKGEMPNTGMSLGAGHQPVLGTSACGAQGRGRSVWGGGDADLGDAVPLEWRLASRYRIWHQSHLRTVCSPLPSPSPPAHPHTLSGQLRGSANSCCNTFEYPGSTRPEKLYSIPKETAAGRVKAWSTVSWRRGEPLHPRPQRHPPSPFQESPVGDSAAPPVPSHPPRL